MGCIGIKSTGTIINELITTGLKIQNIGPKEEFLNRQKDLIEELGERYKNYILVESLTIELTDVLSELWREQEVLYQNIHLLDKMTLATMSIPDDFARLEECGIAGLKSLKLNKKRSDLIRRIDKMLGEESSTVLEKSWKNV